MKSKKTAIILAIFLGAVGAHRFYLGQTGKGVLYFLLGFGFFGVVQKSLFTASANVDCDGLTRIVIKKK